MCAEIFAATGADVKIVHTAPLVPSQSTLEIIQHVQDKFMHGYGTCVLGFTDGLEDEFLACIEVKAQDRAPQSASVCKIACFKAIGASTEDSVYAEYLLKHLSAGRRYLQLGDTFSMLHPSTGTYTKVEGRPSLAICTPCYKRIELLKIYCTYMVTYFIPHMVWGGYDVCLILCGGEEEKAATANFLNRLNVLFFTHENNLGVKKNLMFNFAKDVGFDYVTTIDSDDFVHPETTAALIDLASQNGKWSAIEPFYFRDLETGKSGIFEGYPHTHQLHKWGMGSARVFTRAALMALGDSPFVSGNKGMDDAVKLQLSAFDLEWESRLISSEDCSSGKVKIPIGVKSSVNIWSMKSYKTVAIDPLSVSVNWLPPEIQAYLRSV